MEGMNPSEPDLSQGESALQEAIVDAVKNVLSGTRHPFLVIERFGLDVAAWVEVSSLFLHKFLELKVFLGARQGGVGFGNGKGEGTQVDLLIRTEDELRLLDRSVRWIIANGTVPPGSPRYSIVTSIFAKRAAMRGVKRGKQNNLRIADFQSHLLTWPALLTELSEFLLR